jgi:hypothetical protein
METKCQPAIRTRFSVPSGDRDRTVDNDAGDDDGEADKEMPPIAHAQRSQSGTYWVAITFFSGPLEDACRAPYVLMRTSDSRYSN